MEAFAACAWSCETLEETQKKIAQAVTYERKLQEAQDIIENSVYKAVYEQGICDDYDGMTENEKHNAISSDFFIFIVSTEYGLPASSIIILLCVISVFIKSNSIL